MADVPGREITQNARLLAAVTQATNDALIAVFDVKYHYCCWRHITAIRNGDIDGNDATEREPSWGSFYRYANASGIPVRPLHCVGRSRRCAAGGDCRQANAPVLRTTSRAAGGIARSWTTLDKFTQEVQNARIYNGVHYRHSAEAGTAMRKQIGGLA